MTALTAYSALIAAMLVIAAFACGDTSQSERSNEPSHGVVSGSVYHDTNQNGIRDECDYPLDDVPVSLERTDGLASTPVTARSGESGEFGFPSIAEGVYRAQVGTGSEETYLVTDPVERHVQFELGQGDLIDNLEFGLARASPVEDPSDGYVVTGVVFEDIDGDGEADAGECGISTVATVFGLNRLGSEPVPTLTGFDGGYVVTGKGSLNTVIRAQPPTGEQWRATTRGEGIAAECTSRTLEVQQAEMVTGVNFGFQSAPGAHSIEGLVFSDLNGDQERDPDEPGIEKATIFVDPVASECQFLETLHTATNEAGRFELNAVPSGKWELRVQNIENGRVTSHEPEVLDVRQGKPLNVNIPVRIYERSLAEIYVFEDLNSDWVRQESEPPAPFALVCLGSGDIVSCHEVDENGYMELNPLGAAFYRVTLSDRASDGALEWVPVHPDAASVELSLDEGDSAVIELPARRAE